MKELALCNPTRMVAPKTQEDFLCLLKEINAELDNVLRHLHKAEALCKRKGETK